MGQSNVDVGVFQETKLTDGIYTRGSDVYKVVATSALSRHRGDVALYYQDSPAFAVKAIRQFDKNITACHLATGERRWYIVRCYLAPGNDTTIRDVEAAMTERPRGTELIVAGDFNVDLEKTGGWVRDKEIALATATAGLKYLAGKLLLQRWAWCKDRRTWVVVRQERVVRSHMDCILGSDRRIS